MSDENTITVSVDPGKHHAGWAIFVGTGKASRLVRTGIAKVKPPKDTHGPFYRQGSHKQTQTQSAVLIAEIVNAHVEVARRFFFPAVTPVEYVAELPHVYLDKDRKMTSNADPVDLFYLTLTCGSIAGEIRQPKRVRYVEPAQWKQQRSDSTTWRWIRGALTPGEVEIAISCGVYDDRAGGIGKAFHHGLEAIGIGLWGLFRL